VYGVSFLGVNTHVITTLLAGIGKLSFSPYPDHLKSYPDAVASGAILTGASYLYHVFSGNALAQVTAFS
jgi:hypothetical protein